MLAIQFDFTANRYHATQWGRHVNEGVLEWPPSPWRILRAIVATWRRTLPDLPEDRVVPLLEQLASEHPHYRLPPASTGHTRHYMPYNEGIRERTTLVIDSFVAIQPAEPVVALWPGIELDQRQTGDLTAILRNMPYLGRAESWVDATVTPDHPEPNSTPMEGGALPAGDLETVRTLVPRATVQLAGTLGRDLRSQTRRSYRPRGRRVVAVHSQVGLLHLVPDPARSKQPAGLNPSGGAVCTLEQRAAHGRGHAALGRSGAQVRDGTVRKTERQWALLPRCREGASWGSR